MTNLGLLICGHGSRDRDGIQAFEEMVSKIRARHSDKVVEHGFLEFAHPTFDIAVDKMYKQGARDITAIPAILFPGGHLKNDMPYEMNTLQALYKDLRIRFGRHLGVSPQLLKLSRKLIEEAESRYGHVDRKDTCLLAVGRGTSDPDANSDVAKAARMLWEGMGFGFATTAFIGVTHPLLQDGLPILEGLPFKRVIAIPFFLFTGVLLKKIYGQIDAHRASSSKEFIYTRSFESDGLILDAMDERILEVEQGNSNMNCQLCKYRTQIVGFEKDMGREQVGHHFHVRGSLAPEHAHDHELSHRDGPRNMLRPGHSHGHSHGHGDHNH
jgi:sirohydrochlorin cobaltochelatase